MRCGNCGKNARKLVNNLCWTCNQQGSMAAAIMTSDVNKGGKGRGRPPSRKENGLSSRNEVISSSDNDSDSDSNNSTSYCGKCVMPVTGEDNALWCESCKKWFHCGCLKINVSNYKKIQDIKDLVRWFCYDCDGKIMLAVKKINELEDKITAIEERLEEDIEKKVEEILDEKFEREKRKNNLIIFGLQEAREDVSDPKDRIGFDVNNVENLHVGVDNNLKIEGSDIEKVVRLGKRNSGPDQRPRPLSIKFKSVDKKYEILGAARNLKDAQGEHEWKKRLFIVPDYTMKQRNMQKEAYEEFKRRKAQGEQDIMIKNFKVVKIRNFRQPLPGSLTSQGNGTQNRY